MAIIHEATENPVATHQWRHTVKLKHLFTDEPTHEAIDVLCRSTVTQLRSIATAENSRRDQKDDTERDYLIERLESLADSFNGLIGAVEGETIQDREDEFNYQLCELHDLGDTKIELRDGGLQKFLWVG